MGASRLLGVTGPAGSGKSTVLDWLAQRGAATLDADAVVRRVLLEDAGLVAGIRERFGAHVMDGPVVNRAVLADVVFADPAALAHLEALIHPVVTEHIARWRAGRTARLHAVEAVKLVESELQIACHDVWLVLCDRSIRLARLACRGWTADETARRLASAPPLAPELARADAVIDTSGPWVHTAAQLESAWASLTRTRRGEGETNL